MNRRDFIKGSALLAAGAVSVGAQAAEKRVVRAAIVGCGGRGRGNGRGISDGEPKVPKDFWNQGAIGNMMYAAKLLCEQGVNVEVKPVAFADYFLARALDTAKKFGVDEKNAYGGANGYKEIMKRDDVDVVILTTPLNFRPRHTMAAIESGKHVFAEKGVAVDAPGVRLMIAAARKAEEKKLTIVCGTQRRHQRGYLLQAKALKDGTIGPILGGEVYWNSSVPWIRERKPGQSNKDYLCNNWLNFAELSGDHICEQHVHNIDVANWFLGRYPKSVVAFGARMRRVSGNQYDFFSGDFDYGDGVHIHSMCRQIDGCKGDVREYFRTANEIIAGGSSVKRLDGTKVELVGDFPDVQPYVQEHVDLLKSMLGVGPYLNEGEACAMSTACGIMIRISAYTGQIVTMNDLIKSENSPFYNFVCKPTPEDFEKDGDVPMPEYGDNQYPLPGQPWRGLKPKKA